RSAHAHALRSIARQGRRLGADRVGLLLNFEQPVHAVHAAGAVHLLKQFAEPLWLGFGGIDNRFCPFIGAAADSEPPPHLVARLASFRKLSGSFGSSALALSCLCCLPLDALAFFADGN